VVNGALEYLAKDLGIAENAVLQGMPYFYMPSLLILPWFPYCSCKHLLAWPFSEYL
jgi:hypothetical protein